jgi:hypothetical protein
MSEEWRFIGRAARQRDPTGAGTDPSFALPNFFAADESAEARMLLAAGRAADQVRPQSRDLRVDVATGELELDVPVEILEALVAAQFRAFRPKQPPKRLRQIRLLHRFSSYRGAKILTASSGGQPCSVSSIRVWRS